MTDEIEVNVFDIDRYVYSDPNTYIIIAARIWKTNENLILFQVYIGISNIELPFQSYAFNHRRLAGATSFAKDAVKISPFFSEAEVKVVLSRLNVLYVKVCLKPYYSWVQDGCVDDWDYDTGTTMEEYDPMEWLEHILEMRGYSVKQTEWYEKALYDSDVLKRLKPIIKKEFIPV